MTLRKASLMEHYLLHLSYSPSGWSAIVQAGASFEERLAPVRNLVAHLGGSFASFHFFDTPGFENRELQHVVRNKFAMFATHDLMAVVAVPDKLAAQALSMALSSQSGIASVALTAMVPFEETITKAAAASKAAMAATGYRGPGTHQAQ